MSGRKRKLTIRHEAGMRKGYDPASSEEKSMIGGVIGFFMAIVVLAIAVVMTLATAGN